MKIKTADLIGPALDCAVATCDGYEYDTESGLLYRHEEPHFFKRYSSDQSQGGPIIEREGIKVVRGNDLIFPKGNEKGEYSESLWLASYGGGRKFHGPTPLIAAMRCHVAATLGDEVDVPDELV